MHQRNPNTQPHTPPQRGHAKPDAGKKYSTDFRYTVEFSNNKTRHARRSIWDQVPRGGNLNYITCAPGESQTASGTRLQRLGTGVPIIIRRASAAAAPPRPETPPPRRVPAPASRIRRLPSIATPCCCAAVSVGSSSASHGQTQIPRGKCARRACRDSAPDPPGWPPQRRRHPRRRPRGSPPTAPRDAVAAKPARPGWPSP